MGAVLRQAWQSLRAQPAKTTLVLLLTLLLLGSDFRSRLYTPIDRSHQQGFASLQLPATATAPRQSEPIKRWLAQSSDQRAQQAAEAESTAEANSSQGTLPGATELDDSRLLVRATFISSSLNQRLALIELQQGDTPPRLITAREQDSFGRFQLTQIGVHQLRFTDPAKPDQAAIIAPVFAGASTLQQGSNNASEN
ncbi:hypothetical protein QWY20_08595 [Alkalimonas sp. MEB108]|uniref:Type II secretion system protein GspC N-terminal domain-containing protein n=1 Tax=Alkalimonas cellulosilytica TaxID=3058395 RepID=A0ABU7J4S7_9GAMM|nr:hypothetical protein [Alkalimonas sp. MEB108]MEE2001510.1 hypothetical protein [Alkalimonas sp. MEB108]